MANTENTNETVGMPQDNGLGIQDLLALCIGKWPWFVLSVAICVGLALAYLMTTPKVYTRTATLLIKEEGKHGNTFSTDLNNFTEMGLFSTSVNVSNEIIAIQSPDLLLQVVRRLNLDVSYYVDGSFKEDIIYGNTLPLKVDFRDLAYNDNCSFTITIENDSTVTLSDFMLNGELVTEPMAIAEDATDNKAAANDSTTVSDSTAVAESSAVAEKNTVTEGTAVTKGTAVGDNTGVAASGIETMNSKLATELHTPVGRLTINASPYWKDCSYEGMVIHVRRSGLMSAVNSCSSRLTAALAGDKSSTVIDITYNDLSIQRAEDFLNTLISAYNENWIKDKNQIAVSTSQFINERLRVIERELGNVDSNISEYKSVNLIPDIDAASQMYMNTANQTSMQINDLNNQLYMARYILDHVNDRNSKDQLLPANSGISSTAVETQISDYNTKMLQRNNLIQNSSEENPLVKDLDNTLAEMRSAIVTSIDNEMRTLDTQIRSLQGIRGMSNQQIAKNPQQANYLLSVERQQKVKESLYLFLLQKREENELSQAFTAYNSRVVTSPNGTNAPTSPKSMMILLVGLAMGVAIPAIIIYLREMMNTKVRGRNDLEKMTIPFVGEIPLYMHRKSRWPWKRKKKVEEENEGKKSLVVKPKSRNIINEAFRVVRSNMEFMAGADQHNKVIMVTSINPGSGKTFLTANIATSFAIKDKRIITIDLDMRRASLSEYVGKPKPGIADYLNGKSDDWRDLVTVMEGIDTLHVIPVGTTPPNPAELLYSPKLKELIEELKQEFDLIFIDCPPVEIVADASIVAPLADMTLFIIRAGLFEREMLPVVESYYTDKKFNNMCMLLNATTTASGRYGYHRYGYRYGYHYGYSYGYGGKAYGGYTKEEA